MEVVPSFVPAFDLLPDRFHPVDFQNLSRFHEARPVLWLVIIPKETMLSVTCRARSFPGQRDICKPKFVWDLFARVCRTHMGMVCSFFNPQVYWILSTIHTLWRPAWEFTSGDVRMSGSVKQKLKICEDMWVFVRWKEHNVLQYFEHVCSRNICCSVIILLVSSTEVGATVDHNEVLYAA